MPEKPRIAILASFSGQGGVERMLVNLTEGILETGCCSLDVVLIKNEGPSAAKIPEGCRVIDLPCRHSLSAILPLVRYLWRYRPVGLLAAKDRVARTALLARALSRVETRVVLRLGTNLSASLAGRSFVTKTVRYLPSRLLYHWANAIVAVSGGVARDIARITGLPLERIRTVANPVITPRLYSRSAEPVEHPWLKDKQCPVLVAAGRLTRQKDFSTLLRALAKARRQQEIRLIILGEGKLRFDLEKLAAGLGLKECLDLPGFAANPYAFMRQADLFVLSSIWEGSPNVLTEALALGTPVVSTDCPSGPREILQDGKIGPLVPPGDHFEMARTMLQVLDNPPDPVLLTGAVEEYRADRSARKYLQLLLPEHSVDKTDENTGKLNF